jgi:hypothetical protein
MDNQVPITKNYPIQNINSAGHIKPYIILITAEALKSLIFFSVVKKPIIHYKRKYANVTEDL